MFLKSVLLVFSAFFLSCGSSVEQTQNSTASETTANTSSESSTISGNVDPQKLMAEGYMLGTIMFSDKEGDCPYTIQMPGDKMEFYYLDPLNLDEKYKVDGLKVWVKFKGLRTMNRCDKATPAEITDIKKGG